MSKSHKSSENPFRVRPIRKNQKLLRKIRHSRHTLYVTAALLLIGAVIMLQQNVFAQTTETVIDPSTVPAGFNTQQVSQSPTYGQLNLPTAPPQGNTVGPTFQNIRLKGEGGGYIYNENTSDTSAEQSPLNLFDFTNVWGPLNAMQNIKNTNGPVIIDDDTNIWGNLSVSGTNITMGGASGVSLNYNQPTDQLVSTKTIQALAVNTTNLYNSTGTSIKIGDDVDLQGQLFNNINPVTIADDLVLTGAISDSNSALTINDDTVINGGTEPLTLANPTGEANITFLGNGSAWQVGSGWTEATGGAPTLFFYNNTTRQRMALEQDGMLTIGSAETPGGLGIWGDAAVTGNVGALGAGVFGSLAAASVGRFYQSSGTWPIGPIGWIEKLQSCDPGDIVISCSAYIGTPGGVLLDVGPNGNATRAPDKCAAHFANTTAVNRDAYIHAVCFSPDG